MRPAFRCRRVRGQGLPGRRRSRAADRTACGLRRCGSWPLRCAIGLRRWPTVSASGPSPSRGSSRCRVAVRSASAARSRAGATGRAARGPRRSPMRAPPPEVVRRPADRSGGPSTARAAARRGTSCQNDPRHLIGDEIEDRCAPPDDSPSTALRRVPDDPGLRSGEVHRQRGVALLQQAGVGHEVRGADDRHGAAVVACSAPARPRSTASGARRRTPRRCRSRRVAHPRRAWPRAGRNPARRRRCPPRRGESPGRAPPGCAIPARREACHPAPRPAGAARRRRRGRTSAR